MSTESRKTVECGQHLVWTTKRGSQRADSHVGGYWITWTEMPAWPEAWCNLWIEVNGVRKNLQAGTREQCKRAAEEHYAKTAVSGCAQQSLVL